MGGYRILRPARVPVDAFLGIVVKAQLDWKHLFPAGGSEMLALAAGLHAAFRDATEGANLSHFVKQAAPLAPAFSTERTRLFHFAIPPATGDQDQSKQICSNL